MTELLPCFFAHSIKCFDKFCLIKLNEDDLTQVRNTIHEVIVENCVNRINLLLINFLNLLLQLIWIFLNKLVESLLSVEEVT